MEPQVKQKIYRYYLLAALCQAELFFPLVGNAEEGGSGHYQPGSIASFIDGVPAEETFLVRYNLIHYKGSVSPKVQLPVAGTPSSNVEADVWGHGVTLAWAPGWKWGDWNYAMSMTLPLLDAEVSADVGLGASSASRSDSLTRMGDLILMPLMLNYTVNPDLNVNFRTTVYAPTGDFETGRLANTGKNYWSVEPTLGLVYFGQHNGHEASLYLGVDFNTENPDTDYKSGSQLHLESTLAQHFPLADGVSGVGVSGYYYKQVSGDSGDGATLGDFKAKSVGVGPVLSYMRDFGEWDLITELKWLHEYDTSNRLEGDVALLKVVLKH